MLSPLLFISKRKFVNTCKIYIINCCEGITILSLCNGTVSAVISDCNVREFICGTQFLFVFICIFKPYDFIKP